MSTDCNHLHGQALEKIRDVNSDVPPGKMIELLLTSGTYDEASSGGPIAHALRVLDENIVASSVTISGDQFGGTVILGKALELPVGQKWTEVGASMWPTIGEELEDAAALASALASSSEQRTLTAAELTSYGVDVSGLRYNSFVHDGTRDKYFKPDVFPMLSVKEVHDSLTICRVDLANPNERAHDESLRRSPPNDSECSW